MDINGLIARLELELKYMQGNTIPSFKWDNDVDNYITAIENLEIAVASLKAIVEKVVA